MDHFFGGAEIGHPFVKCNITSVVRSIYIVIRLVAQVITIITLHPKSLVRIHLPQYRCIKKY